MTKKLTDQQIADREALLEGCPIIGITAATGTGKTLFCGTLPEEPRYRKVLFIDADRGGDTIAAITRQDQLCVHRKPPKTVKNGAALAKWLITEIKKAHKDPEVSAILIEGIARIYEDMVGDAVNDASEETLSGHKFRRLFIVPSNIAKGIIVAIGGLQHQLIAADRRVPIAVTCNMVEDQDDDDNRWETPALSDKNKRALVRRCQAFVQLQRPKGDNLSILTDRDKFNKFRKIRGELAAKRVAAMRKPDFPSFIQAWADALGEETRSASQHLQTENNDNG